MLNHYKEHYKLYKSGKLWVTAMLATGALVTTTTVAKADTITNSQAVQTPNAAVVSSDTNRDGKTSATGDYALSASSASANDESNVQTEKATPSDGTTTALSSNQVPQSENQASATPNALDSAQPSQALKATASNRAPQTLSSDLEQKLLAVTTNDLQTKYPVNTGTNVVLSDNWSQMSNDQKVALAQAFLGSDNSIDQTTIDPTDLAMTLNYFDRLYNFTIGSVNVRDLILRDRRKIGSTATAADLLAAIQSQANQTSNQLLSGNNSATFFNQKLAPLLNTKDLPTTIEAWIDQFDPQYQGKYNQWFADTFAGVVVDTAPIESLAGLDFSAWANAKRVNNGNIILPLLTKVNEHTYLAGIPMQLVVGSMANYTSDFSAESKAKFKQKIQNWASGMRSYFNTWTKINPPSVTAIKSKIGMSVDSNGSQTATTATDPTIRNF